MADVHVLVLNYACRIEVRAFRDRVDLQDVVNKEIDSLQDGSFEGDPGPEDADERLEWWNDTMCGQGGDMDLLHTFTVPLE